MATTVPVSMFVAMGMESFSGKYVPYPVGDEGGGSPFD